jgi:hypothetical protein
MYIFSSILFQSAEVFGCQIGRTGACVVEVLNVDCEELMAEVDYYNVTYRILSGGQIVALSAQYLQKYRQSRFLGYICVGIYVCVSVHVHVHVCIVPMSISVSLSVSVSMYILVFMQQKHVLYCIRTEFDSINRFIAL